MRANPFFCRKNYKWRQYWDEENQCYTKGPDDDSKPRVRRKRRSREEVRMERLRRIAEPIQPRKMGPPFAPHIDEWLNRSEVRKVVAESNKYAPKNYPIQNIIAAAKAGRRNVQWKKIGRHLYVHEADLRESLKERPIYAGSSQSPSYKAMLNAPFHEYLTQKPDDGHIYATVKQAADVFGEKAERIYGLVKSLSLKAFMINSKLHVRLGEVKDVLPLRPSVFIKRCGLNPDDYKVVRTYFFNGYTFSIHYAPDLIGK